MSVGLLVRDSQPDYLTPAVHTHASSRMCMDILCCYGNVHQIARCHAPTVLLCVYRETSIQRSHLFTVLQEVNIQGGGGVYTVLIFILHNSPGVGGGTFERGSIQFFHLMYTFSVTP